jgi:hypothetical protein
LIAILFTITSLTPFDAPIQEVTTQMAPVYCDARLKSDAVLVPQSENFPKLPAAATLQFLMVI